MNEVSMSFPIPNGRLILWRYLCPHNAEWMWGVEEQIEGEERVIQWWNDFHSASMRFELLLEKHAKKEESK